ncbi:MAG: D-aminoacyl-tRNA deacylase [Haloarculaceae archaeon]
MIAVVVSRADRASEHVGEHLLALADWDETTDDSLPDADGGGSVYRTDGFELRTFAEWHLELDGVASAFDDPDLLVFASRHSGETGPLLTAHFTGNFGPADHGGEPNALARACPNAHSRLLEAFAEHAPEGYEVGTEATHHGPTDVGAPSLFVELGSGEAQWDDPAGARAVARSILDLAGEPPDRPGLAGDTAGFRRQVVGFGGGHYAPRFERVVRETDWAVGHVAPDWGLDAMGHPARHRDVIEAAFVQSDAELALLDGEHPSLASVIEELGYRIVSETWLRAVDGVPLALVDRATDALCPVEDGLRFGTQAETIDPDAELSVVDLPTDLLAEAQAVDRAAAIALVAAGAVAYEATESATRLGDRALLADPAEYDALIDGMCGLLREKYDAVDRATDAVVAHETAFDPAKAAELGVPEGPKFGRLADGEPVRINDETVTPDQVRTERVHRFPV